jgi:hypothetical protein
MLQEFYRFCTKGKPNDMTSSVMGNSKSGKGHFKLLGIYRVSNKFCIAIETGYKTSVSNQIPNLKVEI